MTMAQVEFYVAIFVAATGIAATIALSVRPVKAMLRPRLLGQVAGADRLLNAGPLVSVIVPACNEAAAIRACLESLAAQDYPSLEIIAIDDRSTDETGAIMADVARRNSRVRVIHNRDLPGGWLGKSHANQVGAQAAEGQWLLFTDGDVLFSQDAIRLAVAHAGNEDLDHLPLFPGLLTGGFWESAMCCCFGVAFMMFCKPWRLRDPNRPDAICGVGAFNLVSRRAYDAIGTHRRLKLEVGDDWKLGKLLKHGGFVSDVLGGWPHVRVRWQVGMRGVVRGLEKNAFCGADYRVGRAVRQAGLMLSWGLAPIAGMALAGGVAQGLFAVWFLLQVGVLGLAARQQGQTALIGLTFPVVCAAMAVAMVRSAALTLYRGGVSWRGSFYPLADLRRELI